MSKRILFFDDDKNRHRGFAIMNIGCDIDHVYSAQECIRAMRDRPRYDLISLDHDMDLNEFNTHETGTMVAEYIRLHLERDKYPTRGIVIHSHNETMGPRMRDIIADTGMYVICAPFVQPYTDFQRY